MKITNLIKTIGITILITTLSKLNAQTTQRIQSSIDSDVPTEILMKIAENKLSNTIKAFTFKATNQINSVVNINDYETPDELSLNDSQRAIINHFSSINGVKQVSYDIKTNSYTVITDNFINIKSSIYF